MWVDSSKDPGTESGVATKLQVETGRATASSDLATYCMWKRRYDGILEVKIPSSGNEQPPERGMGGG